MSTFTNSIDPDEMPHNVSVSTLFVKVTKILGQKKK